MIHRRHAITNTLNLSKSYKTLPVFTTQQIVLIGLLALLYIASFYHAVTSPYVPPPPPPPSAPEIPTTTTTATTLQLTNQPSAPLQQLSAPIPTLNAPLDDARDEGNPTTPPSPNLVAIDLLTFSDYCFILGTHLAFFIVGWRFFLWKINHDVERLFTSILLFSTTFALSCSMFVLILAEILGAFQTSTRWVNWKLNLATLLFIIFVLLPISFLHEIVPKTIPSSTRAVAISILYLIFFYLAIFLRNPLTSDTQNYDHYAKLSIENGVSRLSVLGVTLIALMSGYGAINLPHQYLVPLIRQISDSDVILFNRHWNAVVKVIAVLKRRILVLDVQIYYQRVMDYKSVLDTSPNTRITTATRLLLNQSKDYEAMLQDEFAFSHRYNNASPASPTTTGPGQTDLTPDFSQHRSSHPNPSSQMVSLKQSQREGLSQMNERRRGHPSPPGEAASPGSFSEMGIFTALHQGLQQPLARDEQDVSTTSVDTDLADNGEHDQLLSHNHHHHHLNYNNNHNYNHNHNHNHTMKSQLEHKLVGDFEAVNELRSLISPPSFNDLSVSRYDTRHSHILPARILGHTRSLPLRHHRSHIQQLSLALPKSTIILTAHTVVDRVGTQHTAEIAQAVPIGITTQATGALDLPLSQCLPHHHAYNPANRTDIYRKGRIVNLVPNHPSHPHSSFSQQPLQSQHHYAAYSPNNAQAPPTSPPHDPFSQLHSTSTILPPHHHPTPRPAPSSSSSSSHFQSHHFTPAIPQPSPAPFLTSAQLDNIPTRSIPQPFLSHSQLDTIPTKSIGSLAPSSSIHPGSTFLPHNRHQHPPPPINNISSNFSLSGPLPPPPVPPPHRVLTDQGVHHTGVHPHPHTPLRSPRDPVVHSTPPHHSHLPTASLFQPQAQAQPQLNQHQPPFPTTSLHHHHHHHHRPPSPTSRSSFSHSPPLRPNKFSVSSLTKDSINREFYPPTRLFSHTTVSPQGPHRFGAMSRNIEHRSSRASTDLYGSGFRKRSAQRKRFSPWNVLNYPIHWFLSFLSCFGACFIKVFTCTYVSKRNRVNKFAQQQQQRRYQRPQQQQQQQRQQQHQQQLQLNHDKMNEDGSDLGDFGFDHLDDFSPDEDDDYYDDELVVPPVHLYRGSKYREVRVPGSHFNGVIGDPTVPPSASASQSDSNGLSRHCSPASSILTPYQHHLVYLTHALDRQQDLLSEPLVALSDGGSAAHSVPHPHQSPATYFPHQSQETAPTIHTNHAMQSFLSKRNQLVTQLAVQLDIQRRLSTDIYQLSFERQQYRKLTHTLLGRFQHYCSYSLAAFGMGKILITMKNIIFGKAQNSVDIPTKFMTFIVHNIFHIRSVNVQWWISYVSLFFLGGLVATQMRGFLINFTKIFRAFSLFISPSAMLSISTIIMGVYFVSMVLLSRIHLPIAFRTAITHVLGHLQFDFYHNWFDLIFFISAITTLSIFYTFRKMRPTNDTFADGYN